MGQLTCELHHPGMTALHRVGLAGLYMTLEVLGQDAQAKAALDEAGVAWHLEERRVTVDFADGKVQVGLTKLLEFAFQLDNQGFIRLPGLELGGAPSLQQKWLIYQALLGTFLQFGPHRPTAKRQTLLVEIDDKQLRIPDFGPIQRYRHQDACKDFVTKKGALSERVPLVGWLYPGGSQRHVAWSDSFLDDPSELAFCLLFAPAGAIFFHIASRHRGRKARTALVVPQVTSLSRYARLRRAIAGHGVLDLTAASPTDAALQLAVMAKAQEIDEAIDGAVRVFAFGIVVWNEKQKSRTAAYTVAPSALPGLRNYELASRVFLNRWQKVEAKKDRKGNVTEPEHHFVRPFTAREIVADNIASRRRWYAGFAEYMTDLETRTSLQFERKELHEMTQLAEYDHQNERIFIATCHEAWRRRLGKLSKRAGEETKAHSHLPKEQYDKIRKALFGRLASGDYEKLRVSLVRCKNAESLRAAVTDFWARAGSLPSLHEGWVAVLPLLDEDWRKARDLALLSLASYQPTNREEQTALNDTTTNDQRAEP
jgi:CRISPR-associated protein Cas8a1/Csx13